MAIHNFVLRDKHEVRQIATVSRESPRKFREAVLRSYLGLPPTKPVELETITREELGDDRIVKRVEADVIVNEHGEIVSLRNVAEVPDDEAI